MKMPDQEGFWDKMSSHKEFPTPFQIDAFEKHVSKDMHVLDVGCGYGRTLHELQIRGYKHICGVDFSQGMINRGLKQYPQLNLIKNSHPELPFADHSFDAVILIALLTCIAEDKAQNDLIREIKRILKDNGLLYINDFLINKDHRNKLRYDHYQNKYKTYGVFEIPEGGIVRHHTKSHVEELTDEFHELVFEPVVYTTMNGNKSNGFYFIGRKKSKTA
jgi:ubiquinone/menaquinone biosynthesis C-methylase UbiE